MPPRRSASRTPRSSASGRRPGSGSGTSSWSAEEVMTPERWQAVKALLDGALRRSPGERSAFLVEACGADAALRAEVESLLAVGDGASGFLEPDQSHRSVPEPVEDAAGPSEALAALRAALGGRYAIERELGRGGMATVYLAGDLKHQRTVAVTVPRHELAAALGDRHWH